MNRLAIGTPCTFLPTRSQNRHQPSSQDQRAHPRLNSGTTTTPRRSGLLLPPRPARPPVAGAGVGHAGVDERRPAHDVDAGGRLDVVEVQRLAPVRGPRGEDGHGGGEAGVAGRLAARGQGDAQGQVVDVAVGRGADVCDCVGEAVVGVVVVVGVAVGVAVGVVVLQAGGVVRDVVGEEAGVGLAYLRVFALVVVLAGARGAEGLGEGGHEGGAGGEDGGAGGVEDGGDGGEGTGGVEEGHGVLEKCQLVFGGVGGVGRFRVLFFLGGG